MACDTFSMGIGCPCHELIGNVQCISLRQRQFSGESDDQDSHQGVLLQAALRHQVEDETTGEDVGVRGARKEKERREEHKKRLLLSGSMY